MLVVFRLASLVGCLVAYRLVAGWQLFVCCFLVLLLLLFMLRDWCGFCGYWCCEVFVFWWFTVWVLIVLCTQAIKFGLFL